MLIYIVSLPQDAQMRITDLQRMKHEERVEEDNTVHFYLLLTYHMCDLYNKEKKRLEEERRKSLDSFEVWKEKEY